MVKLKRLILFISLTLVLTACGQQDYLVEVRNDNTVLFISTLSIPSDDVQKIKNTGLIVPELNESYKPVFEKFISVMNDYGFAEEYKEADTGVTLKFTQIFNNINDFNSTVKKMYDNKIIGLGMNIAKSSNPLSGGIVYNGVLKYMIDDDLKAIIKDNEEAKEFFNSSNLSSSLTIINKGEVSNLNNINVDASNNLNRIVKGNFNDLDNQERVLFNAKVSSGQSIGIFAVYAIGIGGIVALFVLFNGKERLNNVRAAISKMLKKKGESEQ